MSRRLNELNKYILEKVKSGVFDKEMAFEVLKELNSRQSASENHDIAIIGMACKYPGVENPEEFWQVLKNGVDVVGKLPHTRRRYTDNLLPETIDPDNAYMLAGYLREVDIFDADFFELTNREALLMDPNHRLFLMTAYQAIEDAGYGGERIYGTKTGVYVGKDHAVEYSYKKMIKEMDPLAVTGSWASILARRIAYIFNLQGPAVVFDTACSSSLVGLHMAIQALRKKECDMALIGGINLFMVPVNDGKLGMVESGDGFLRAFDKQAKGTVWGEGVGAVILKPLKKALEDRDHVYAVIKGSAINNDGASSGLTAPNAEAQGEVIINAWKDAEIEPETITYIETHGTGTELGDPIEIKGITNAFRKVNDKKQFCGIGSVKTNIGHNVAASGIASLIKMVMALKYKQLPASLNFDEPNPYINFPDSPVFINDRLRNWDTESPRRAGISSYGFSGTNCHIVIEEAPSIISTDNSDSSLNILTLSAKNYSSLIELIKRYKNYTETEKEVNIDDLCYTANTGRGHYSHRLALIIKNFNDLKKKFKNLIEFLMIPENQLTEYKGEGVFYGTHKIISSTKKKEGQKGITEGERRTLSREADLIITDLSKDLNQSLIKLCQLYVAGANINWNQIYQDKKLTRVNLPPYPYKKKRYWLKLDRNPLRQNGILELNHPLLHRCIAETPIETVYTTSFSQKKQWELREYKILDSSVLPSTACLEMVLKAISKYFPVNNIKMEDVSFIQPIVVKDGQSLDIQTIINRKENGVKILSKGLKDEDGMVENWLTHMAGKFVSVSADQIPSIELDNLFSNMEVISGEYQPVHAPLSSRWRNLKKVYQNKDDFLLQIELPEHLKEEGVDYYLHPALLDTSLNFVLESEKQGIYLPKSIKHFKLYAKIPDKFFAHITQIKRSQNLIIRKVSLISENGQILAEFDGYVLKRFTEIELKYLLSGENHQYYHPIWQKDTSPIGNITGVSKSSPIVIFTNNEKLSGELVNRFLFEGIKVIEVQIGDKYEELEEGKYIVGSNELDYQKLCKTLKDQKISKIIHLASVTSCSEIEIDTKLKENLNYGLMSLFYLVRGLHNAGIKDDVEIVMVSDYVNRVTGTESLIKPHHAPIFGLGKIINYEQPNIRCRGIDIDEDDQSIDNLFAEINSGAKNYLVAYRKGSRYIPQLVEINQEDINYEEMEIKDEGVYVITGGTGGIGLNICHYLASKNKVKLALINRSPFPEREDWDKILTEESDSRLADKIKKIKEIEAMGSVISIYSGDVSNVDRMKGILKEIKDKYGTINGIIHLAGIAGKSMVILEDEMNFQRVLAPKVIGTWVLHQLTAGEKLDFFVMISSMASIFGFGNGAYVAANSYLDSFVDLLIIKGINGKIINYPIWENVGLSQSIEVNEKILPLKILPSIDALYAFDMILNSSISRVLPGRLNYNNVSRVMDKLPFKLSKEIENTLQRFSLNSEVNAQKAKREEKFITADAPLEKVEAYLAEIWAEVFGVEKVDREDNFYELGGHSLNATLLASKISKAFDVQISLEDIFNYPTVKELAAQIISSEESIYQSIEPVKESEYYQVSSAQKRLYVLYQLNGANSVHYNIPGALVIEGNLDRERFTRTIDELVTRHESFRTSFHLIEGQVVQKIHLDAKVKIDYVEVETEEKAEEIAKKFVQPFDLGVAPLLRIGLIKVLNNREIDKYVFLFDMHHIISDGFSLSVLVKDFIALYQGKSLPELKIQYKDFAVWQNKIFESPLFKKKEEFWLDTFSGEIPQLNLPTDYTRPAVMSFGGDAYKFNIKRGLATELNNLAGKKGATLYMVLLAAYNVLLYKYTGQEDIIVGTPIAGRPHADLENMIGMFVNTLAMRNYPGGNKRFSDFLDEVKERALKAYENQDYQFEMLVEKLNLKRDLSRNPLFDTMFALQNTPVVNFDIPGLNFDIYSVEENMAKFDLSLTARENPRGISFVIEYSTRLFKRDSIERMAEHFENLIRDIIKYPDKPICQLNLLSTKEREFLIRGLNDNHREFDTTRTVYQYIEEYAQKEPDKTALLFGDKKVSYGELNTRANQLAWLLKKYGSGEDRTVGILMERSPLMVESILAVWKSGGAYIPIDIKYPEERIASILKDSKTQILLTLSKHILPELSYDGAIIRLDEMVDEIAHESKENLNLNLNMNSLSYVIYTSGSTGKPKGAMVEHIGMMNHIHAKINDLQITEDSTIAQNSSHCFDISVWQFFTSLICGGKTVIYSNELTLEVKEFINRLIKDQVTVLEVVPSFLSVLLDILELEYRDFTELKYLLVTGEAVKPDLVRRWFKLYPNIKMVNAYGPTEASDDITHYIMDRAPEMERVPIGWPIQNMNIYIVDSHLQLCPVGVKGEICVSGVGVGRGYLNDPQKTKEVFLDDPFANEPEIRMYKTGDIGRWISDGVLEFYGRKDYQVKISGFRIELGEIENKLVGHPQIKEAVVLDREDEKHNKYLCAYLVLDEKITPEEIKEYLAQSLPYYMIPAYYVFLDKMPLNQNGKIDRNALPEPGVNLVDDKEYVAPRNEIEEKLAAIWCEILGIDRVGINDNFFEVGGNSIKILNLAYKINKEFGLEVKVVDLFRKTTISQLADFISKLLNNKDGEKKIIKEYKL